MACLSAQRNLWLRQLILQGLMAKPKHEDDETVKAMLAALATYRSGERHE